MALRRVAATVNMPAAKGGKPGIDGRQAAAASARSEAGTVVSTKLGWAIFR